MIQSDFITSASRESVVDVAWNHALCEAVAQLFISVVSGTFTMPDHPLRYSWLDYLPAEGLDHPWKLLRSSIVDGLKSEPVLQTWEQKRFRAPIDCRFLLADALHEGEPILPDLAEEVYLASDYSGWHSQLRDLGVRNIHSNELIDRLQADLARRTSRTKTTPANDQWHEAFANLFLPMLQNCAPKAKVLQKRIKMLDVIPLSISHIWVGAPGFSSGAPSNVYFSDTDDTEIPSSVSLKLLNRIASHNPKRRAFYKALGVEECTKSLVFRKIKEAHSSQPRRIKSIAEDLRFLFEAHYTDNDIKSWVWVPLIDDVTTRASILSLYFPSNEEFDMFQLIPDQDAEGIGYLSEALLDASSSRRCVNDEDWKTWLTRTLKARYYPPLTRSPRPSNTLSSEIQLVEQCAPGKFLGLLRAHWDDYQAEAHLVSKELSRCLAPCRSGRRKRLWSSYLPTSEISEKISRIGLLDSKMPLLDLPEVTLDASAYRSWKFLTDFGVKSEPDLKFYMVAMRLKALEVVPNVSHVAQIYQNMAQIATVQNHRNLR